MARDTIRNAYFYVGIPRHSPIYQQLVQESNETGISIPQLIVLRTSDWYKGNSSAVAHPSTPAKADAQDEIVEESYEEVAASNANAALDEWL